MPGCLKNVFATVGCVTVLAAAGVAGWEYRAQLAELYHSVTGDAAGAARTGYPSPAALASGERKEAAVRRADGPSDVTLTPAETAALIAEGLAPGASDVLDSLSVTLAPGRLTLQGRINTAILNPDFLGPFKETLARVEPFTIAGPVHVTAPGLLAWTPDVFTVHAVPFPASAVPRLTDKLTGRTDGAIPIVVPRTIGDVRIRAGGVTFYRRTD
jgi:hypothetical protein